MSEDEDTGTNMKRERPPPNSQNYGPPSRPGDGMPPPLPPRLQKKRLSREKKLAEEQRRKERRPSRKKSYLDEERPPSPPFFTKGCCEEGPEGVKNEKCLMVFMTIGATLGTILWIVAITTNFWYTVYLDPTALNISDPGNEDVYPWSSNGLWSTCSFQHEEIVAETKCKSRAIYLTYEEMQRTPVLDRSIRAYRRAEVYSTVISSMLMTLAMMFAYYNIYFNFRYTFKRLAAALYFMTAGCLLVLLEIFTSDVKHEHDLYQKSHPLDHRFHKFGAAFYCVWCLFFLHVICGVVFLMFSRKHKKDTLDENPDEENMYIR